jgi:hypothetical protein
MNISQFYTLVAIVILAVTAILVFFVGKFLTVKQFVTLMLVLFIQAGCLPANPIVSPVPPTIVPTFGRAMATQTPEEKPSETTAEEIVKDLIAAKLAAMEAKDIERYLALIDETEEEYYTEQRNWFLIYQDAVTSDFSIKVLKAENIDDATIIATIYQHYLYGPRKEDRTFNYEAKFAKTADGWKDADLNFRVMETPHFIIKYPQEVEAKAIAVSEDAEIAYASVVKELGLESKKKAIIKLYADQEMLRQSTDIRIAYLFNGWGEAGESIKMFAYREAGAIPRLVAHELVHKITLEITDCQTSWLAEGMATYFGNRPFQGGDALQSGMFTAQELSQPITWLEEKNLGLLTDEKTIRLYYAISGMVVEFIVETYGLEKLQALLIELSKYPPYDGGYDYTMEPELQQRLYQAIETVFGVKKDAFNEQWLAWISSQ